MASSDKYKSKLSPLEDTLIGAFMMCLVIVALALNILVCMVIYKRRKKILPQELIMTNLCVTNIGITMSYPMFVYSAFVHHWDFGDTGCSIYGFLAFSFGVANMVTLVAVSIVRYLVICYPVSVAKRWITKHKMSICIAIIYTYAFGWSVLPYLGWGSYSVEPYGLSCTIDWSNPDKTYVTSVSIGAVFGPIIIMVGLYWRIICHVRRTTGRFIRSKNVAKRKDVHLTKIAILLCLGFVLAWFPYAVLSLFEAFGDTSSLPIQVTVFPALMAKASACYNPIVYSIYSSNFRKEVKTIFKSSQCSKVRKTRSQQPIDELSVKSQHGSRGWYSQINSTSGTLTNGQTENVEMAEMTGILNKRVESITDECC